MTSRKTSPGQPRATTSKQRVATAQPAKPHGRYRLEFLESALREWRALDGSVKDALKKLLANRLANPHVPGAELHGSLAGCYKIKLRAQGYRLVYQVRDEVLVVLVVAIDRRDKNKVYRAAMKHLEALAVPPAPSSGPKAGTPRSRAASRARRFP